MEEEEGKKKAALAVGGVVLVVSAIIGARIGLLWWGRLISVAQTADGLWCCGEFCMRTTFLYIFNYLIIIF